MEELTVIQPRALCVDGSVLGEAARNWSGEEKPSQSPMKDALIRINLWQRPTLTTG